MPEGESETGSGTGTGTGAKRFKWRPWLRGMHRDVGYLLVGLTFVYALSGLAVNHIGDDIGGEEWNASFVEFERTIPLTAELPVDPLMEEQAAAEAVLEQLAIEEEPSEVFGTDIDLQILLDNRELFVDYEAETILDRGQRPRFFLRVANWLHLNRGKAAWTVIADGYAVLLLFLAVSGMFMIPGKKGLVRRGWVLVLLGAAVPVLYVTLSGGP